MAVRVNGALIDDASIEREAERLLPPYRVYMQESGTELDEAVQRAQLVAWAEENLVEAELLRQAERQEPVELPDSHVADAMRMVEAQYGGRVQFEQCMNVAPENLERLRADVIEGMRAARFTERLTREVAPPESAEVEAYYRTHPAEFRVPELLHVRHIVKNAADAPDREAMLEPLRQAREALDAGADFGAVADRFSDCPGNGGDLGTFPGGSMVESFERVVRALRPGQISDIFPTEFGFHIAQLLDREPPRKLPLAEVREAIAGMLLEERRRRAVERFLDELKARSTLERVEAAAEVPAR